MAVEGVRQRLDRVDIGGETAGRLRFADADDHLGLQPAERIDAGGGPDRLAGLREDVVGKGVTRDAAAGGHVEAGGACRAEHPERGDAHILPREPDPDKTRPNEWAPSETPK